MHRQYLRRVAVRDKRFVRAALRRKITTVGRVIFNEILDPQMPFYDLSLSSKMLARIIADCYQILGRRATIDLLDRMKRIGFRESTRSGLSFATARRRIGRERRTRGQPSATSVQQARSSGSTPRWASRLRVSPIDRSPNGPLRRGRPVSGRR